jgi:quinohemoprotein ethanol dehydrogenase
MGRSNAERQWPQDHQPQKKSGGKFKFRIAVREISVALAFLGISLVSSVSAQTPPSPTPDRIKADISRVDSSFIEANTKTSRDWPTVGLDYAETRFSKLDQINSGNVKELGLAWSYNLESSRGIEATPLVVDGIMYQSAPWNVVHAIDARTGKKIWTFDPGVDRSKTYRGCCDAVSRGLALYKGRVFEAVYDGRLIALDAATGAKIWEKDTLIDHAHSYTITGSPRVFNGKVVIGQSGAEYGVRGYITAYDSETGNQLWRWFTVPGDPSKPFEDASMEAAAKTWDPSAKYWINGGGGAPWDTITFDPDLNMVYVGTGNGGPWNRKLRSPAGGDNLYLASIVALNADTGKYIWHYQETPGDNWDYTSTQPMILADLTIDGVPRKVILHAPKNGFFFVIDRTNGKFISAKNFVDVNWATGYDANGRPIELPAARDAEQYESIPGPDGAHNWMPMSYNPITGLVYIPAQHNPVNLTPEKTFKQNAVAPGKLGALFGGNIGFVFNPSVKSVPFGRLLAWDPVHQKEVWRVEHVAPWNGGTLTTAGNLVFQGTADGRFVAYDAAKGTELWDISTGTGAVAAASTYMIDDKQYVSIAVGWGGSWGITHRATDYQNPGTIYTFVLGGTAKMPEFVKYQTDGLLQGVKYDPKDIKEGANLYLTAGCIACHGVPGIGRGGNIINLGYAGTEAITNLRDIVFKGPFRDRGMPDFSGKLTEADVVKLQAFIQGTVDSIRPKGK